MKQIANFSDAVKEAARLGPLTPEPSGEPIQKDCGNCGTSFSTTEEAEGFCGICRQAREEQSREERQRQEREELREHLFSEEGWKELLRNAGVPPVCGVPVALDIPEEVKPFLARETAQLTFQGPVGTGKTWTATRIFGELVRRAQLAGKKQHALWLDTSDALRRIKAQWRTDDDGKHLERMIAADLLLLDDLGAEPSYEYAQADVSNILRQRYNWQRRTIVTCQSLDQLEARIASRLAGGTVIRKLGPDRRVRKGSTNTSG